jgi:hypothetical protein
LLELAGVNDNHNLSARVDLDACHGLARCSNGLDRSSHVLLPECGGGAGHDNYREVCLWGVMLRARERGLKIIQAVVDRAERGAIPIKGLR